LFVRKTKQPIPELKGKMEEILCPLFLIPKSKKGAKARRLKSGIFVDETTWRQIKEISQELRISTE